MGYSATFAGTCNHMPAFPAAPGNYHRIRFYSQNSSTLESQLYGSLHDGLGKMRILMKLEGVSAVAKEV